MKVAFIGLGIMGYRMASNLLKKGIDLTVGNRSRGPVEELVGQGAKSAETRREVVQEADVFITMLSTPEVVEEVVLAEGGCIHYMKPDSIWLDCSTVHPSFTRKAASLAQAKGIRFLDAPVAGTKPQAEAGELVFFVGGEVQVLDEVRELLGYMGMKILHVGETGMGASYKMLVNGMLAQNMIVFAETLRLGLKLGFDKDFLLNSLPNLAVAAPFTKGKAEMIRNDLYETQFPLEWMLKDLHLLELTAYEHMQPMHIAALAKELFIEANRKGLGREDFAAVYKVIA